MKQPKRIIIVANGQLSDTILSQIQPDDYVIGVDKAAYWLINHKIIPNISLGDFDSVTKEQLIRIKKQSETVIEFSSKKDATDLELAIDHAIRFHPKEVLILGAIGTRLDHSFVAVQLLEKFVGSGIVAFLRDDKNECVLCDSKQTFLKNAKYKYLSILPVTDEIVVSITGCVYPLKRRAIHRGVSLGISNEIVSKKAVITIHEGVALVIQSND